MTPKTHRDMLCVSIVARDNEEVREKMLRASRYADVLELRLDLLERFDLSALIRAAPRPVMVTYRSKKEGGQGRAPYATRLRYLKEAISLGARYVDLEYSMPLEYRAEVMRDHQQTQVIVSKHILSGTPSSKALRGWVEKLISTGADIIKLVTRAKAPEDNIRILEVIPMATQVGIPIIAFCMGRDGRMSRVASLLVGGFLTFASLGPEEESAEGQIPVQNMRKILELMDAPY